LPPRGPFRLLWIRADTKECFETTAHADAVTGSKGQYWIAALFGVLIGILVYLGSTSDLLRYTTSTPPKPLLRGPFSLGAVQMAFWFCLSLVAYVYICVMTKQVHVPMGSTLGLLEISSTTGLASIFVSKQKGATSANLPAETTALTARIKDLTEPPGPAASNQPGILSRHSERRGWHQFSPFPNRGVDHSSGTVFIWPVFRNMIMPGFDASPLTLMGMSSGTYGGFKFTEKSKMGDGSREEATEAVPTYGAG
jgi:hypothetical protein